jgi:hypothetical protein
MFVPAAAYAADIQDEIGRLPTDAVLGLDILFGAALGAEASDVPFAFLSPHVSIRTLPGMPPATSGLGQPRTPQERAEVDAASAGLAGAMNAPAVSPRRDLLASRPWAVCPPTRRRSSNVRLRRAF